jgi:hypothetical protein
MKIVKTCLLTGLALGLPLAAAAKDTHHEAPLGAVHRRAADPDRPGDFLVAGSGIGRHQDLRPLQLAHRTFAPAQQRGQLAAFRFAQLDPVPYIQF